jgi:hypothetical protein
MIRQKQAVFFSWTKQQHGFAWIYVAYHTYLHVRLGQLLFADKKYLLLKRITVQ